MELLFLLLLYLVFVHKVSQIAINYCLTTHLLRIHVTYSEMKRKSVKHA